jgi:hypothetical protein
MARPARRSLLAALAVAVALPAAASSEPVSSSFTISGREYAFTSTRGFFAGNGNGNRGGTAYWNATVKHDKLGPSPAYVNGGSVAITVRDGGISVDAIVGTFARHGGTIATLVRGENCTNQKYLVTGRLERVLTTSTSNGTGSLSATLTHYRHRVLGRCLAYKASVAGTVTFAY